MAERFRVIFSGKLAPGARGDEVLKRLMQLFKADAAAVRKRFTKPGCTVVPDVDLATGERMLAAIRNAGAICELLPLEATTAPPAARVKQPPQEAAVVDIKIGRTELTLAPLPCSRVGHHPQGLKTNRLDRPVIPFEAIIAVSAFLPAEHGEPQLLLFSAGFKRPLQVGAQQITFGEFAGVSGTRMIDSLRAFLRLLREKSPVLIVDRHTMAFAEGGELHLFPDDPNFLATALFHAHPRIAGETAPDRQPKIAPEQQQTQPAPTVPHRTAAAKKPEQPEPGREDILGRWEEQLAPFTSWFDRLLLFCAIAFWGGFLLPLYQSPLLSGGSELIWFWNLAGRGISPEQAAALSAISGNDNMAVWALAPLAAGLAVFLLRSLPVIIRIAGTLILAVSVLSYFLVDAVREGAIFGLLLLPPTETAGTMILLVLSAAAVTAAVNHVRRSFVLPFWLTVLGGVCGGLVASAPVIALAAGVWKGWIIYILYAVIGGFGVAALYQAYRDDEEDDQTGITGILARLALLTFPLVSILAQDSRKDDFLSLILAGSEELTGYAVSTLKLCLITYPAAMLLAAGLSMLFAILITAEVDE